MSDPTERYKAEPHPISSHRTPEEIAEDEAGPIGNPKARYAKPRADQGPIEKVDDGELAKAPSEAETNDEETVAKAPSKSAKIDVQSKRT
jgi:hypothetical protein